MKIVYTCPECGAARQGPTPLLEGNAWYLCFCGSRKKSAAGTRMTSPDDSRDSSVAKVAIRRRNNKDIAEAEAADEQ